MASCVIVAMCSCYVLVSWSFLHFDRVIILNAEVTCNKLTTHAKYASLKLAIVSTLAALANVML